MDRGWPAVHSIELDGWRIRLSGGVTSRANSVLPLRSPLDPVAALAEVEQIYAARGLRPCFQLSPGAEPAALEALLETHGYEPDRPSLVQTAGAATALRLLSADGVDVSVHDTPDEAWMDRWWSVDGRGGADAYAVARRILTGGPALYASLRDGAGTAAVARLALVEDWGGLYCLAVRPDARGRGHARAVLAALLAAGVCEGATRTWLQVLETNHPARSLYEAVGFSTAYAYHYRTLLQR